MTFPQAAWLQVGVGVAETRDVAAAPPVAEGVDAALVLVAAGVAVAAPPVVVEVLAVCDFLRVAKYVTPMTAPTASTMMIATTAFLMPDDKYKMINSFKCISEMSFAISNCYECWEAS